MNTNGEIVSTKLICQTDSGKEYYYNVTLQYLNDRIFFLKAPFGLKDEIKVMRGSHWHGRDDENPKKMWSVDDCPRNRFQLAYLEGENVYEWFDQPIREHEYDAPLMPHQRHMTDCFLTLHFQIAGAEMGVGKTLSAQKAIEMSGKTHWYWVGPKSSLPNIKREFKKWNFPFDKINVEFFTYEGLARKVDEWVPGESVPHGLILDESSRLKGPKTQRTTAAMRMADMIRAEYGFEGYVILMSGTPSPKSPVDWWSQCEVTWPGYLREGSAKALEERLAFMVQQQYDAGVFKKRKGWKDNDKKCKVCGELWDEGEHLMGDDFDKPFHQFVPSANEVAYMYERLKGLVIIKHKKDCLTLPDKRYRKIYCKPAPSVLRLAQAVVATAPNVITGATLLREISDGFMYGEEQDGTQKCPLCKGAKTVEEWYDESNEERVFSSVEFLDGSIKLTKRTIDCQRCDGEGEVAKYIRTTRNLPCPKDKALVGLLEECEETGRIVIFAGFTGSVDRCVNLCHKEKWDVVRCDGRGFHILTADGQTLDGEALDYWADLSTNQRVAFIANPESGGMSLTLVEARMAVYWSNTFKPEYRTQSEDRIHRKGMDENLGCEIVDIVHLPTDERVLEVIRDNRKLELMSMGELRDSLNNVQIEELAA